MRNGAIWASLISVWLAIPLNAADLTAEQIAGQQRAGWPETVAWYAVPSWSPHEAGYFVGGGAASGARPGPHEGTWGWDFCGWLYHRRIALGWGQGPCLGQPGTYKTDGPHPLGK